MLLATPSDVLQPHISAVAPEFSITFLPVSGNKMLRADPFGSQLAAENVSMVRAEWNRELLDELRSFPLGKYDDIVDAVSDAYHELVRFRTGWSAV